MIPIKKKLKDNLGILTKGHKHFFFFLHKQRIYNSTFGKLIENFQSDSRHVM